MLLKASIVTPGVLMEQTAPKMDAAQVITLDEYLDILEKGFQSSKASFEKTNPGQVYPFANHNYARLRAELEQQLKGHDAVVERYIHIKRSSEK